MENTPVFTQDQAPAAPQSTPARPAKDSKKLLLIIAAAVVVLAIAAVLLFVVFRVQDRSGSSAPADDSTSAADENVQEAEMEVVWGAEGTDNSGDAYVAYQESILNSSSSSAKEKFDAILSLANFEITIEDFTAAESRLLSLNTSNFSVEDSFRFYNVLTRLYEVKGDVENRDKYSALATEYRNLLISESSATE